MPSKKRNEHFKRLNEYNDTDDDIGEFDNEISEDAGLFLNCPITEDEIKKAIANLKNGKSAGDDRILNEYLKTSIDKLMPIYLKLFNIILDTGIIPENWCNGIIIPIFKNKGSKQDPESYRGITLNSCFSKVFSSILNSRLNKYSDSINLISKAQAGFRRGFSTIDNIFVLFALISIYFSFGKKLYCTFIDFKSAFDTVWRAGLWQKLQKSGVKGKVFTVILNMYQNVKSYVKLGHDCSEYFSCDIGVKQGENLSPFLFSIFLNDLETFFVDKNINCLDNISQLCHDSLLVYIKLFIILYADDTALLSESAEGLQSMLNSFEEYCTN